MKKIIFLLLLVSSLLIVSCQETAQRGAEINYKLGFSDLEISSLGNKEEYQDQRLELPISIHNTLAYDIENVAVSVQGFDTHYVELYSSREQLSNLEGKSIFNPEGREERILFEGTVKKLLPGASKELQNYRVYAYFNSKVEFSPTVCVTSQQAGYVGAAYDTYQGACAFEKEVSYSEGQGAPLGITNLELIPRQGRQIELRMRVENKGKGKVGKISLATATLGGKPLSCDFRADTEEEGFSFEPEEKSATLLCAGALAADETYRTPLYLELLYDYELNVKETLTILQ